MCCVLTLQLLVIASIHQPSTKTFNLFDKVYLLSKCRMCYGGNLDDIAPYFASIGHNIPDHTNPAEWLLELVDVDFANNPVDGQARLERITHSWAKRSLHQMERSHGEGLHFEALYGSRVFRQTFHLLHRNFLKSYRDLIAYWIRVAMYVCEYPCPLTFR